MTGYVIVAAVAALGAVVLVTVTVRALIADRRR